MLGSSSRQKGGLYNYWTLLAIKLVTAVAKRDVFAKFEENSLIIETIKVLKSHRTRVLETNIGAYFMILP